MKSNLITNPSKRILKSALNSTRRSIHSTSTSTSTSTSSTPPSSSSIRAAILVSRPPTITREPSELESTYFKYNQKLKFNLSQPFPKDFYFKKGSSAEGRFEKEQDQRRKELSTTNHNDNQSSKTNLKNSESDDDNDDGGQTQRESTNPDEDLYKTLDRKTEADHKGDMQSLERKLDRNLWLFVKESRKGNKQGKEGKDQGWRLPSKDIGSSGEKELLHKAAPSALTSILGTEMDLWLISNLPVGLVNKGQGVSEKTYILPAHILSGSPSKSLAEKNGVEFVWLTKEEAFQKINESEEGKQYWSRIEGLLD